MVWIRKDTLVTVCKPIPTTQHQDRQSETSRLDEVHGELMSALLVNVRNTATTHYSDRLAEDRPSRHSGNGCSRWLIRRSILLR